MDFITHLLTGELIYKSTNLNLTRSAIYAGCIIPDLGEIIIQKALAKKFGEKIAVYDDRTSDVGIAADIKVTFLYDLLHSPLLSVTIIIIGVMTPLLLTGSGRVSNVFISFGIGLFSHFLLDCFTHGKVWALKIFYPFSNKRYPLLENKVGNWWDWQPVVKLPLVDFPFPIFCAFIWIFLIIFTHFFKIQ
jgi:hypothetical protein